MNRLFGFLLGSVLAGAGLYYYVIDEYKVSNELLTEDIYVRLVVLGLWSGAVLTDRKTGSPSRSPTDRDVRAVAGGRSEDEEIAPFILKVR